MTDTTVITGATDNGDGTWTSPNLTDNGNGTWTDTSTDRDIDVTASPITCDWQVMGTTAYPITTGATTNDNGYAASTTNLGAWAASPLANQWATGPIWIQES